MYAEDGSVDEAATRTAFDTVLTAVAETAGRGKPRGFGATKSENEPTQDEVDEARRRRAGLTTKGA